MREQGEFTVQAAQQLRNSNTEAAIMAPDVRVPPLAVDVFGAAMSAVSGWQNGKDHVNNGGGGL